MNIKNQILNIVHGDEKKLASITKEFVSATDLRVSTIRELMDLGLDREEATNIKNFLSTHWTATKSEVTKHTEWLPW